MKLKLIESWFNYKLGWFFVKPAKLEYLQPIWEKKYKDERAKRYRVP